MRRRRKLLVVMEDGSVRRLLAEALSLGGYDVIVTGREATGLSAQDKEQLNLILYDVSLSALPTEETPCRSRMWDTGARVVAFSDPPTAEMARLARDLGAREYVGDPFDLSTLLRVIADNARPVPIKERTQLKTDNGQPVISVRRPVVSLKCEIGHRCGG